MQTGGRGMKGQAKRTLPKAVFPSILNPYLA